MSLVVWLPLNGDLRNNGISGLTFSTVTTNTTTNANGKIGTCYGNNSNSAGGVISNTTYNIGAISSMACWVKFTSLEASSNLGGGLVGQHRYSNNTGMGLTIRYVSATTGYISVNTGNGSGRTYNTYYGKTLLSANTWYHVAYTYDGSNIRLYVNGALDGTHAYAGQSSPDDYIHVFCWSTSGSSGNSLYGDYKLNGYLNDVRIYNHCLSTKEIKEIAKGLCLHYKLDNNGAGNKNLSTQVSKTPPMPSTAGTAVFSVSTVNGATRITCTTAGTGGRYNSCFANASRTANTTYTWSADVRASKEISGVNIGLEGGGNATFTVPVQWKRISRTAVLATDSYSAFILYPYENAKVGDWIEIKNLKVEVGSKATPWCPSTVDTEYNSMGFNTTTEIDVSGYKNNGTKVGNHNSSSDTIKYSSSVLFNSTNQYITLPTINTGGFANTFTLSWWSKTASMEGRMAWGFSNGNSLNLYPTSSVFCMNTGDGGSNPFKNNGVSVSSTPWEDNKWHHYSVVGNGSANILYIDGIERGRATAYKAITGTQIYISGWDAGTSYKWNGNLSDFRIYATDLSANDIKEMYQTSVSVDKQGNLFCGEVVEE